MKIKVTNMACWNKELESLLASSLAASKELLFAVAGSGVGVMEVGNVAGLTVGLGVAVGALLEMVLSQFFPAVASYENENEDEFSPEPSA
jgi:hypothetical protein